MDNKDCNIVLIFIDFCKIVFLVRFCRYFVLMIIVYFGDLIWVMLLLLQIIDCFVLREDYIIDIFFFLLL